MNITSLNFDWGINNKIEQFFDIDNACCGYTIKVVFLDSNNMITHENLRHRKKLRQRKRRN